MAHKSDELQEGLDILRAAMIDGRTENVRWRQNEFQRLHAALREKVDVICEAISKDASSLIADAQKEFYLTMDAIRQSYETLDFDRLLKEEYSVKDGKDNLGRRVGLGLVVIRPTRHTRFYSILTPLVAAIAAGNCVLLELESSQSQIDAVLKDILPSALDRDTFYISSSKAQEKQLSSTDLLVNQVESSSRSLEAVLTSPSNSRVIAVIDRTADINIAAKAITTSRLSPHNTSPYCPDLVVINDFVSEEFRVACLKYASLMSMKSLEKNNFTGVEEIPKLLNTAEAEGKVKIYADSISGLNVVEVKDRSSPFLTTKITGPYIILTSTTSITDTVAFQRSSDPYLATYHFGAPSVCKFLSESIPSTVSFVNQIPPALLYGPPSPSSLPFSLHPRYTPEMFSVSRPQIVTKGVEIPDEVKELRGKATIALKPTGQKPGHAIGFFEQGILIGLGVTALIVLPAVGWGTWMLGRGVWRYARR